MYDVEKATPNEKLSKIPRYGIYVKV